MESKQQIIDRSAALKKELRLFDLVLAQILIVIGVNWIGTAAKLGTAGILLWLVGIVFYFLPLTCVIIHLTRQYPLEGGLYQWAKFSFNEFTGFLTAWNGWLFVLFFMSLLGINMSTGAVYALGEDYAYLAENKLFIATVSAVVSLLLTGLAFLGLEIGKWFHNLGAIILFMIFGVLIFLPVLYGPSGSVLSYSMPELSLFNLTLLVKTSVFSLSGFEAMAVLAGESRNAGKNLWLSVAIAAPVIALMYIAGTFSALLFVNPGEVDLVNPIAQIFHKSGLAANSGYWLLLVLIVLLFARDLAQSAQVFTTNSRLPMVAGWDKILPEWFTRLHKKRRTPVNAIVFAGIFTFGLSLLSLVGAQRQEAFQLLQSAAGILFAVTYLILFLIPIAHQKTGKKPPVWLRIVSAGGFLVILAFIVLSIFPIVEVENPSAFGLKVSGAVILVNAVGIGIYLGARRRKNQK